MRTVLLSILGMSALSASLCAQPLLERVDAGFADRDELATSLFAFTQVNLQHDRAFARLYVDPLDPDALVRLDGALIASFPRSEYRIARQGGELPIVPAGVEYSIGPRQAEWQLPPSTDAIPSTSLSERQSNVRSVNLSRAKSNLVSRQLVELGDQPRVVRRTPSADQVSSLTGGTVMSTESYRRMRLRELSKKLSSVAITG
ncbi:MAG: hypothetical protein AAGB34_00640 [Planctomycetota bacterium]